MIALVKATIRLETFPMAGRPVPEFEHTDINLREIVYKGYRIIYRLNAYQDAEIITVTSGREDLFNNLDTD